MGPRPGARQAQLLKGPKFLEGVLSAHPACSARGFRLPADHGGLQLTVADHCVPVCRRMSSFRATPTQPRSSRPRSIARSWSRCSSANKPDAHLGATGCGVRASALAPNSGADYLCPPRDLSTGQGRRDRDRAAAAAPDDALVKLTTFELTQNCHNLATILLLRWSLVLDLFATSLGTRELFIITSRTFDVGRCI